MSAYNERGTIYPKGFAPSPSLHPLEKGKGFKRASLNVFSDELLKGSRFHVYIYTRIPRE